MWRHLAKFQVIQIVIWHYIYSTQGIVRELVGLSLHLHSQDVKILDLGRKRDHLSVAKRHRLL